MANASLFMDVIAKDSASAVFNKIGNAADGLTRANARAAKSQTAANRTWQNTRRLLVGLGTSYAAYKIAQFAKQSVAAASALQEQVTATDAVFGKNAKTMRTWANTSVEAFGQSRREALQYSNSFGTLANSIELGDRKQMSFSKSLTRLSTDMASFKNTTIAEAAEALQSGLVGETEPLRRFGIFLNDAKLKAKAFEMGLSDGKSVLDEHAKALAAYEIIMETARRTNMKGDFGRTANNYANQVRVLQSNVENLKATLGAPLMGAANEAFQGFNETLPQLEKILGSEGANRVFRDIGKGIGDAARWVATHTEEIQDTLGTLGEALERIGGAAKRVWDVFASLPPGVQDTLTTLSMAGIALNKIPGAATLGKGIVGGALKAMNVNAGVVNVNGPAGGPTGAAGKGKGGFPGWMGGAAAGGLSTVLIGTLVAGAVASLVAKGVLDKYGNTPTGNSNRQNDIRNSTLGRGSQRGEGIAYVSQSAQTKREMREVAAAAKDASAAAGTLVTKIRLMPKPAKEAAAEANRVAAAIAKAAQAKTIKLTVKGAKDAANDAEDLANKIKRIQNKDAKITARSARKAAADAVLVASKIKAIPNKDAKVTVNNTQAIIALAQVTSAMAVLQSKTIYLDVVRRESGNSSGAGAPGMLAGARPVNPGSKATAAQKKKYERDLAYWQTEQDAKRQQRMSRYITTQQLSDNAADWLTGLDPKVARRFMKHPKRLGRFARMASSVSDNRALRDAQRDYDAAGVARGLDSMSLAKRQQTLADRVKSTKYELATAKHAAQKARLYAKLQEQEEQLASANAALAEAEVSAQEAVRAAIEETASSYRSFASIATLTTDDVTAAQDKLVAAQDAVTEARRKMDLAGNDRDRAAAARELAAAEAAATAAQTERNNVTDKPTSSSIRANMAGKLTKLKGFAAAVKQLKANGLNATTLADILSMGPDQGYDYAKALLDGGLGDINAVQADINATSADLGLFSAGVNSSAATAVGLANALAGGLNLSLVPAPVTLNLDGRAIATSLLEYHRQTGG